MKPELTPPDDPNAPLILYIDANKRLQVGTWVTTNTGQVTSNNIIFTKFGSTVGSSMTNDSDDWGSGDVKFNPTSFLNSYFEKDVAGYVPKKQPNNANVVRELELCLELSTEILLESTQTSSDVRTCDNLRRGTHEKFEKFMRNNIGYYFKETDAFGGLVKFSCGDGDLEQCKYDVFLTTGSDKLQATLKYLTLQKAIKENPDAVILPKANIEEGDYILDLLRSNDLYKKLLENVRKAYSGLTEEEKDISKGRLANLQERLAQVSQNIINGGTEVLSANIAWFVRISKCVNEYVNITEWDSSTEEMKNKKFRTIILYL